jgi:hypothetical protein
MPDPKKTIIPVFAMRWRYSIPAAGRNRTIAECLKTSQFAGLFETPSADYWDKVLGRSRSQMQPVSP